MRILSPIDRPSEVDALADAGADELYGGYVPASWRRKYSLLGCANHRYFKNAQIETKKDLETLIRAARRRGVKFYLALNSPYYTPAQYEDIVKDAARMDALGVDGFIISDIGLILRIRDTLPHAAVHLSTLGTVMNKESARFFAGMGVRRIVLPRELTVSEIAGIVRANQGVEFDSFVMIGKCPNIEGFCTFTHNSPGLVWPCEVHYDTRIISGDESAKRIIEAQRQWSLVNRRQACGLCAIPGLANAGITSLKIVGRGGPAAAKVRAVEAVRDMLAMADAGSAAFEAAARERYASVFGRECNPYICYFPASV